MAVEPVQAPRRHYQYERNGVTNLFMLCEPMTGARQVKVTERRTAIDCAQLLKDLVDIHYPDVWLITVVPDQLNTHTLASSYKAFEPAEARCILARLAFCYTPKCGSWLNMAEIELSILSRQCLDRRIPDFDLIMRRPTGKPMRSKNQLKIFEIRII